MSDTGHLWEVDHPYYWNEGCFHQNGHHFRFENWTEFLEARGDADGDLNLVARWDWRLDRDDNEVPVGVGVEGQGTLSLFYVVQRKGFTQSCEVKVTGADEAVVRAWLEERWKKIQALWSPLSGEVLP